MKTGKRVLSVFLVILMLLTAAPLAGFVGLEVAPKARALDTSGSCGTNVTWSFNSSTGALTISGSGAMDDLYSKYDGVIAPWYSLRFQITSAVIESGVTRIGDYSFYSCMSLTSVKIPDSVTSIGNSAFEDCTSLTNVIIPSSVTSIGECAFWFCSSLVSVTILDGVTSIPYYAFCHCTSLKNVTIPDSVTNIDNSAFDFCTALTSVTIPNSVTSIGDYAFKGCTSLASVTIPSSVNIIGYAAFLPLDDASLSSSLQKITILNPNCEIVDYATDLQGQAVDLGLGAYTIGVESTVIYGFSDSTAEAYATKYGRTFIALEPAESETVTETDTETGIAVSYFDDSYSNRITLSVTQEANAAQYLVESYDKVAAWNIKTLINGVETQPGAAVTVSIPIPEGFDENHLAVYHVNANGSVERVMPITVKNGKIAFTATSFSVYVVVDESSKTESHTHTYTATVTTPATCTEPGEAIYTCDCGDTYTETIPATGHVDDNNDGHCDACGEQMTGGDHCKFCGKIHNGGFFDKLTGFFHKIFAIFKR